MNPERLLFDPLSRDEILKVLEQPDDRYQGLPYLRITRLDGSDVVGKRGSPPYGIASQYIEAQEIESEVARDAECISLTNVGFERGARALVPLAEVAGIFDFGVAFQRRPISPVRFIQWAGAKLAGSVLDAIGLGLIISAEGTGGFQLGKPIFDRDVDVYRDLAFFSARKRGLTYFGVTVGPGGLSLGWETSLAAAAHDRIQRTPSPYMGICQEAEVVLKGFPFFFLDPDTGVPLTKQIGKQVWIEALLLETRVTDPRRAAWVPVYFAEDLIINYPLDLFLRIDRPLHVYGEPIGAKVGTSVGQVSCYIVAHLAAYLDPGTKRPGLAKRTLRRIIR